MLFKYNNTNSLINMNNEIVNNNIKNNIINYKKNLINKFCIILVIASPSEYYNKLKKILLLFMNSNPHFITFFIYGKVNKNNILKSDYDLYFDNIKESLIPGIFKKTIEAMKYVNMRYDYKYIIRTNLSTFWRLDKLYNFLYKIKNPYFCGGYLDNKGCIHITGTGLIFSKNIVMLLSYFINDKIKNINKPDDVLFTRILEKKFKIYHCIKRNEDFINKDIIIKYNKKK